MSDDERLPEDLFGEDGDDSDGGEDGAGGGEDDDDEFVEVAGKGPLAANIARLRQKVWLVKVPADLWQQLSTPTEDAGSLGELVVTKGPSANPSLQLRVRSDTGAVEAYSLSAETSSRAYVFAEAENDVSFEGTVAAQYSAVAEASRTGAFGGLRYVREQDEATVSIRGNDDVSAPAPDYVPAAREALARGEKRLRDAQAPGRHERLPAEEVRSILFDLFSQKQHWTLRDLIQQTNQPQAFLKEILAEVAVFHDRGPAHGMYELNDEFRGGLARPEA